MEINTNTTKLDDLYQHLWVAHHDGPFAVLDQSLNPRSAAVFYDLAKQLALRAQHDVLDTGCGRGNYACGLAQQFGCHVAGLDPVKSNLDLARQAVAKAGLADLVSFQEGVIEALPFGQATFDFVWCRDMLVHVLDLKSGIAECARVLKPGGTMLVYTTFATSLLEPREAQRICEPLEIIVENLSPVYVEQFFRRAGFEIESAETIGGELMEYLEESEGRFSKHLRRVARMIRDKERLMAELGQDRYQITLALYHWGLYQLLGKLSSTLYILRKAK